MSYSLTHLGLQNLSSKFMRQVAVHVYTSATCRINLRKNRQHPATHLQQSVIFELWNHGADKVFVKGALLTFLKVLAAGRSQSSATFLPTKVSQLDVRAPISGIMLSLLDATPWQRCWPPPLLQRLPDLEVLLRTCLFLFLPLRLL